MSQYQNCLTITTQYPGPTEVALLPLRFKELEPGDTSNLQ